MGRDSTRVQLHEARHSGFWQAKARESTTYRLTAEPTSRPKLHVTTTRHAKYLEDLHRVCRKLIKIPPHQTATASSCSRDSATILLYPSLSATPDITPQTDRPPLRQFGGLSRDSNSLRMSGIDMLSTTLYTVSKGASAQYAPQLDSNIRRTLFI
jgi:hypothetical protein